jgi:hypothetical protein
MVAIANRTIGFDLDQISRTTKSALSAWPRGCPIAELEMCDYSLHNVKSRPAMVGDRLTTHDFGTGTRGFADLRDPSTAVCVRPGTELSFACEVTCLPIGLLPWRIRRINHRTAIFRQINREIPTEHHDALEYPDGQIVLLTRLSEGQQATVLQLPAEHKAGAQMEPQQQEAYAS